MAEKHRIGIIGCGGIANAKHMPSLKQIKNVEMVAFCDIIEERAVKACKEYGTPDAKAYTDYKELLLDDSIDIVHVCTPNRSHSFITVDALEAGKHVMCEKPMAKTYADAVAMLEAAKRTGKKLTIGYQNRQLAENQYAKAVCENGELGEIYSVEAHMDCGHSAAKRQWLGAFPGGMMFFLGCHLVDMAILLRGFPEEIVPYNASTGIGGVTAPDYGFAVLKYPNGVSFVKTCAAEVGGYMRRQLVVTGSKGSVQLLPFEAMVDYGRTTDIYTGVRECLDTSRSWWNDGFRYTTPAFDRYAAMMKGFASYVAGEKENPFTPDYELAVYRAILKACGR